VFDLIDIRIKSQRREDAPAPQGWRENITGFRADLWRANCFGVRPIRASFSGAELCAFPDGEVRQLVVHGKR